MTPVRSAAQTATTNHPAGLAAAAVTVLVWLASVLGLDLPPEVAAAIVGLAVGAVSLRAPRFSATAELADNVPPAGGTGPG
ncbi:hypothetical protein [Patulibacter defluvii]|uniref:hypothetical protein n=1 Tax=Patulibacter defluvii TaxID=3095358 RepID=UPI002A761B17|nr:hypothetical protein [Patulibacter sp. DM4]